MTKRGRPPTSTPSAYQSNGSRDFSIPPSSRHYQSQCIGPPSRYRPCLGGHLRLLDQVLSRLWRGPAACAPCPRRSRASGPLLRCEPNDETQRCTGSPPRRHAAQRGFKGKIGHGLGCGVMTGSPARSPVGTRASNGFARDGTRSVDVPGRVGPEAHSSPVPERTGESLLRHVLSGGPVQATDLEARTRRG